MGGTRTSWGRIRQTSVTEIQRPPSIRGGMTAPDVPFQFQRTGHVSRNRAVLAAMTNKQSSEDGTLSEDEINWLLMRADGGFGIITTAATHVVPEGQGWKGEMGVWGDHHVPGLTRLATGIRERGAISLAQIFHGGMFAPETITGVRPVSASENTLSKDSDETSRELSYDEIESIISSFGDAASRCAKAGFDGVELHGAHGYLICQFLGEKTNRREDVWGGEIFDRARFLMRIIQDVRNKVPEDFILGVRISPEHRKVGVRLKDSLELAEMLSEAGIDFLHISCWDCSWGSSEFPEDERTLTQWFSDRLGKSVPIISAGGIWSTSDAKAVMANGADMVAVARAAIGHADWASHVSEENYSPKKPPFSNQYLLEQGLSETFVDYMRGWDGFVA